MSYDIRHIPDDDISAVNATNTDPVVVDTSVTAATPAHDTTLETIGYMHMQPSGEDVQYEVEMPDGSTETYDTSGPNQNVPTVDPLTKARRHLRMLKITRQLIKRQKRAAKLAESRPGRVAKNRRKNKLAKASRKRNRS